MFTHIESVNNFQKLGIMHISILILTFGLMIFSFNINENKKFEKFLITMIGISQFILFLWYLTGTKFYEDGLPFYTCRLAGLLLVISYLFDKPTLRACGVYLGFVGGIISIITPELYPYSMLHFTNLNFFFYHMCLLCISSYYMVHEKNEILEKKKESQKIILMMLIVIAFINIKIGSNYAYTVMPPVFSDLFVKMKWIIYFIILVGLYQLSILIEAEIIKRIKKI